MKTYHTLLPLLLAARATSGNYLDGACYTGFYQGEDLFKDKVRGDASSTIGHD
jgi:hypothetical protein